MAKTMIKQNVSCGICGFPKFNPECPNSKFGEIIRYNGCDEDELKDHFLKHHPKQYKNLLKLLKEGK